MLTRATAAAALQLLPCAWVGHGSLGPIHCARTRMLQHRRSVTTGVDLPAVQAADTSKAWTKSP